MQTAFRDGVFSKEVTCKRVVLLQKWCGNYRGTCLVDVVWKVATDILNC